MTATKIAFVLAAVLVVIFAGLYLWQDQSMAIPEMPTAESSGSPVTGVAEDSGDQFDLVITFTDAGFEPAEISVPKGTRVRFLNVSDATVWPASAIHPTHSLYPETAMENCLGSSFDSCRELKVGEFFDFTFYYVGEWRYHDHVHAYNTGVITVTE